MNALNKTVLWLALALLAGVAIAGNAQDVELPFTRDLHADGQLARDKNLPIMVVFVAEHCGYCAALEAEYIKPMLYSGEYADRIIIRVLNIDRSDMVDFQGKTQSSAMVANKLGAYVTPTIMFFDADGKELAEKIIGYGTPSLFGGLLESSIDRSYAMVRQGKNLASR